MLSGAAPAAAVLGTIGGIIGLSILETQPAAAAGGLAAASLPAEARPYIPWIEQAAANCPGLPAPVLAAQLWAESNFDPNTRGPVTRSGERAEGIAQFMPSTWPIWAVDANGNGVASPFDPADAIIAQGRFMCSLLAKARGAGYGGDPVALALAGYNAGWGRVQQAHGIPPIRETQTYVAKILAKARDWSIPAAGGGTSTFGTGAGQITLPRANPRSPDQAIAWARNATSGPAVWYNRCLNFVAQAYGWRSSGTNYAIDHLLVTMPSRFRNVGDRNPPPGALLFWDSGKRAGHVALYLGGGMIASNDILADGAISIVPATTIEQKWGARYVGWSPPYFPAGGR